MLSYGDVPPVPLHKNRGAGSQAPLVVISSYVPRKCGIATFTEEALEFIGRHMPDRPIHIISHLDGRGPNVHPIIDQRDPFWYLPVAHLVRELNPYAVHIEHEYGLYEVVGPDGRGDHNRGFLRLLELIADYPTVVEPHTVHGRYKEHEDAFLRALVERCSQLLLKCDYQRWRMEWNFRYPARQHHGRAARGASRVRRARRRGVPPGLRLRRARGEARGRVWSDGSSRTSAGI